MINRLITLTIITFFYLPNQLIGQTSFNKELDASNPAPINEKQGSKENFAIHQKYLEKAKQNHNDKEQVFGLIYLFYDYMLRAEYTKAQPYVLEAENIAIRTHNTGWEGAILLAKGLLKTAMGQNAEALPTLERASKLCLEAGDSLCLGETYEEIAHIYMNLAKFKEATDYMAKSGSLIAKYGLPQQAAINLANYGALLMEQKRFREAISPLKKAIMLMRKYNLPLQEIQTMGNIAEIYRGLGLLDSALYFHKEAVNINKKYNYPEMFTVNYMGLVHLYEEKKDFETALNYYKLSVSINDSLKGKEVQVKVADLELKYKTKDNELKLQQKETELNRTQRSLAILFCVLLLVSFGVWRWRAESLQARKELAQNQDNLTKLTQILLDKNTLLTELEMQINELKVVKIDTQNIEIQVDELKAEKADIITPPEMNDDFTPEESNEEINMNSQFEENLYNQRILTDADWASFKIYFEKAHPHYLARLRNLNPNISEAEERLALFIKLNLTRKEAAAILGISADSVKKTRQRLRKRLGLNEEEELDEYIRNV